MFGYLSGMTMSMVEYLSDMFDYRSGMSMSISGHLLGMSTNMFCHLSGMITSMVDHISSAIRGRVQSHKGLYRTSSLKAQECKICSYLSVRENLPLISFC